MIWALSVYFSPLYQISLFISEFPICHSSASEELWGTVSGIVGFKTLRYKLWLPRVRFAQLSKLQWWRGQQTEIAIWNWALLVPVRALGLIGVREKVNEHRSEKGAWKGEEFFRLTENWLQQQQLVGTRMFIPPVLTLSSSQELEKHHYYRVESVYVSCGCVNRIQYF